jgi:hypothetical protein
MMDRDAEARALVAWLWAQAKLRRTLGYDDILSEARRRNTGALAADLRFVTDKALRMFLIEL